MIEIVKIPKQRLGVLIGKDGSVKKYMEGKTHTLISVNEDVQIEGGSVEVLNACEIVKAIGRGFSPDDAFKLLDEEYQLRIISIEEETEKTRKRLFARVIGTRGKTKRIIQKCTNTCISIYGKTVSIIGKWEDAEHAREAVESLLEGRSHVYVYKFLEKL
jgi:ribosomal RNA assembly protein